MKYLLFILLGIFVISCDPSPINEEELITELEYILTDSSGKSVIMSFKDSDGDGGVPPVISVLGKLESGVTYTGVLKLLNSIKSPVVDITEEVRKEGLDHQIFYLDNGYLSVAYSDIDANGNPIGINTITRPIKLGNGNIRIVLRHLPDKNGVGVRDGEINNAGGESDIDINFNYEVI